jgi:hypothetical protein
MDFIVEELLLTNLLKTILMLLWRMYETLYISTMCSIMYPTHKNKICTTKFFMLRFVVSSKKRRPHGWVLNSLQSTRVDIVYNMTIFSKL